MTTTALGRYALTILSTLLMFFVFQWASIYRDFAIIEASRYDLEQQLYENKREVDAARMELSGKQRELVRIETQLGNARRNFRLKADSKTPGSNATVGLLLVVTPTRTVPTQRADLTRLAQTLMHVPRLHWILVEDAPSPSDRLARLLSTWNDRLTFTHLAVQTPEELKMTAGVDPHWLKPRGVPQRNLALRWIRKNFQTPHGSASGVVVYFADDDNTYDLRLFEEIRSTKTVAVFPVGIVGGLLVERPLCTPPGNVTGFITAWRPERPFPVDMAGFAVNARLIHARPTALFDAKAGRGMQESHFITQLGVTIAQLEPKADLCTKVLVWHTRTMAVDLTGEAKLAVRSDNDGQIEV